MFKVVKIGEKDVPLQANAATGIRYKQVFKKDLLQQVDMVNETDAMISADMLMELAFIMAMSAEKHDMNRLNYDAFVEWLEDFEFMDFLAEDVASEIMAVWQGNREQSVTPKKKDVQ